MWQLVPPVTRALITTIGLVFLLQLVLGDMLFIWFALWPVGAEVAIPGARTGFLPWQLVTYSFLHGNLLHLLFNLLGLYMFGSDVERLFGRRRFLAYYFASVVAAGIALLIMSAVSGGPAYPTSGASGGVFVRNPARLRTLLSKPDDTADLPADPDAGARIRVRLRGNRALSRRDGNPGGRRPFRAPWRDGRRLPDDPLLAHAPPATVLMRDE